MGSPPTSKPLLFISFLVLMSSAAVTSVFWNGEMQVFDGVGSEVQDTVTIVQNVVDDAQAIEDASDVMSDMMLRVVENCNNALARNITTLTHSLQIKVGDLQEWLRPWPEHLGKYGEYVVKWHDIIAALLGIPLAFIFVALLCLDIITLLIRNVGNRACAHCSDVILRRIGSIALSGTILLVASVTALELYYTLEAGTYCYNVDTNVQNTVLKDFGLHSVEANLTEYYLTGQNVNPLDETLKIMVNCLTGMNVTTLDKELNGTCPYWNGTVMLQQVNISLNKTRTARAAIRPENLYPRYNMILHVQMCGLVLSYLGQLLTTQIIVGLVCMPVVSLIAAGYFARWAIWNEVLARSGGFELGDVAALESSLHR